jgi:HAD superfamily hydrolase (TIGR01490 family)
MGKQVAAFYDVDGTLVKTNVVNCYAFYARNLPKLSDRLLKGAQLLASLPALLAIDKYSRRTFNEVFYQNYEGISEDRLVLLADDLFRKVLRPNLYAKAVDVIRGNKALGIRSVLISGNLDFIVRPLARYLEIEEVAASRMGFRDGIATGRLEGPPLAGPEKASFIRRYAEDNDIDLNHSLAYADDASDVPMLSVVGKPNAVNPDFGLRRIASSHNWPILSF